MKMRTHTAHVEHRQRRLGQLNLPGVDAVRRGLIAAGALVMGYAVLGATTEPGLKVGGVALFLAVMVAGHDGLFLPLVIVAGRLVKRVGHLVRAAAVVSLAVTVVAMPFVLGYGRDPDNPSALPLAYGRGLVLILLAIWAPTLLFLLVRRLVGIRQNTVRIRRGPQGASDG